MDLLNGKGNDLLDVFYLEMDSHSSSKSYEKAADYRNKISSLREIQRDQSIAGYSKDRDAISISHSGKIIKIGVTSVRGGWIVSHKNFSEKNGLLREGLLDFAEDQLLANIQEGKTAEILFLATN